MQVMLMLACSLVHTNILVVYASAVFGRGEGPQWLDFVECSGTEESVFECGHAGLGQVDSDVCPHDYDLGIVCQGLEEGRGRGRGR